MLQAIAWCATRESLLDGKRSQEQQGCECDREPNARRSCRHDTGSSILDALTGRTESPVAMAVRQRLFIVPSHSQATAPFSSDGLREKPEERRVHRVAFSGRPCGVVGDTPLHARALDPGTCGGAARMSVPIPGAAAAPCSRPQHVNLRAPLQFLISFTFHITSVTEAQLYA